ncbi:ABC transporter ATP-binding protein [Streptomyces sp. NPDC096339]|uniref:ABC transporter ATP-binding protein n=1 Tax=Streptomyces sp. NPDC096339 TaxID=3366086 RepID=UPI00380AF0DF
MSENEGIRTYELTKTFSTRERMFGPRRVKTAVDGLTLNIPRGRVTGLLGLNGAGKTTTIKMLSTLLRPDGGRATVDGVDLVARPREVRSRINLIAGGERMVYARMTGHENLHYFGQLYDVPRQVLRERITHLLDLVGLTDAAHTPVERYSRGMTQRLAIARGLINDPDYLLLDEPTLGLDAPIARDLRAVVRSLADDGKGVLLTSHYLAEVEELCGHVYVIAEGTHLAEGSPAELTAQTGCHHAVEVTVPGPGPDVVTAVREFAAARGAELREEAVEPDCVRFAVSHPEDIAGSLVTAVVGAGGSVLGLSVKDPSLEDAVMRLSRPAGAGTRPESEPAAGPAARSATEPEKEAAAV